MKTIAPDIFRQRLLVEGFFTVPVDETVVKTYLLGLAETLEMRIYGEPIVFSPASGMGKEENAGFDAFVPLIDSGISLYIWSKPKFFSVVIYTCKGFSQEAAVSFTKQFFSVSPDSPVESFGF